MYRPKYDTIAHKAIKIELEVKKKDFVPNYELLDSIIDEAKANIKVKSSYSEEEATQILQTIDAILLEEAVHHHGPGADVRRPGAAKTNAPDRQQH